MLRQLCALALAVLMSGAGPLWAATATRLQSGTQDTWYSGGSSLANNTQAVSSAVTVTSAGYLSAYCTLDVPSFSAAATAGTAVVVWVQVSTDGGTTWPDGDASVTPATVPSMTFPLRAVSTRQVVYANLAHLPVSTFRVVIRNDGIGVTMNTTWTLKCRPHTVQVN